MCATAATSILSCHNWPIQIFDWTLSRRRRRRHIYCYVRRSTNWVPSIHNTETKKKLIWSKPILIDRLLCTRNGFVLKWSHIAQCICAQYTEQKKKLISIFPFHFGHFHNWSLDSKSVFIELINARARAVFVIDYSFYFQNLYVYHGVIYLVNWQTTEWSLCDGCCTWKNRIAFILTEK